MDFNVQISGASTEIQIGESGIVYFTGKEEYKRAYEDIISLEKLSGDGKACRLHYIQDHPFPNHKLTKEYLNITSEDKVLRDFEETLSKKISAVTKRPRKLAVFVNPIGGKGKGKQICDEKVVPVLQLAGIQTDVVVSQRAYHFKEITENYDFNSVDGLIIMGGDGTYSEIINVLMRKRQHEAGVDFNNSSSLLKTMDFPIGVIPTGSACGLAKLAHGVFDVMTSVLHIIRGRTDHYNTIGGFNNNKLIGYGIICFGYVMYADLMYDTDVNYRWMGTFRYIYVPFRNVFIKPLREVEMEITYEYLENRESGSTTEEEKANLQVTETKRITNVIGGTGDVDFKDRPYDKQPAKKDQFFMLEYTMCGRWALAKHFVNLYRLTEEHLDSVKHFVNYNRIKSVRLRATENNDPSQREMNLRFNIDGESHQLETPDVYIKLFPRCLTLYTSYKGSWRF
ncbi:ceramide kinase 1-like isoform X1 [Mytilus californianus]|uniref:ceramide kinase 1-like isoform X1 n=2 Tax=Mytilus californianus TaxID=6549 RepID=UPI002247ACB6|nr:ceramide kinase 1-like isoform X1 [Mytilus californianus]